MAIITISRGTFSGGQNIAECVAEKLSYRCISREILVNAAKIYDLSEEKLFKAIRGAPGILEHLHSERKKYLTCLRATLINMVKDNNIVYCGNAGHFLLNRVPCTLKVRITTNMESRIQALVSHQHSSREQALEYIKRVDEERVRWTRFLYHVDWLDPTVYDLIINVDHITLASACDILCNTANLEEYKVTAKSRRIMEDMVLSSHIEAIIANAGNISGGENIEIKSNGGVVTIKGTVGSLADTDRISKIVMKTPGVKDIISQMKVRLPGITNT